jgi:hypothetical protein
MPPKGTISDSDPSELVDLLDKKILKRSALGSLFGRLDAVTVCEAGADKGAPQVYIGKPGLVRRNPTVHVSAADVEDRMIQQKLADAGLSGPEPRTSFGQIMYDFPSDVSGAEVADFALGALRALGASGANGWQYQGEVTDAG